MKPYHVYFASCTEQGGIYHYKLERDGKLQFVGKTLCDRPMYMIRDGSLLHVVLRKPFHNNDFSGMVTYEINLEGELCRISEVVSTQGACGCHLCSFQGELYVTNYLSGSVFSTEDIVKVHQGRGTDPVRQEAPHTHCVSPSPDGKYLLVTDLGLDRIYVYDRGLNAVSVTRLPDGAGPRHIVCLNNGCVACVNELDCTVTLMEYSDGRLSPLQTISVFFGEKKGLATCAAIKVYKDYIYVSNRGDNTISAIKVLDRSLELRSVTPCGGRSPRDFDMAGDFLFCANEESSTITVLKVDRERLTLLPDRTIVGVKSVLCICGSWEK